MWGRQVLCDGLDGTSELPDRPDGVSQHVVTTAA